jgi:hypothetical protein
MAYKPTKRQLMNAQKLGVMIVPSSNLRKKLDVYRNGRKISEIGAIGYLDYDGYIRKEGLTFANERRRLYKIRHENYRHRKGTASYYADKILWN